MNLDEALTEVAVLGAAGKMGSGISLLLLQEMARLESKNGGKFRLLLIDANTAGLEGLRQYLAAQIRKYAEKNVETLRKELAKNAQPGSDEEIIRTYTTRTMELVQLRTGAEDASAAKLIFEAIVEDIEVKSKVFKSIQSSSQHKPFFFTNTSSIPISVLNDRAGLNGHIIGYHFYNPPLIQKLLEIIPLDKGNPALKDLALELARRLNKIVVVSKDVAGFIGNGYFLREINFACELVQRLCSSHSLYEAVYMVNKVTQEYLLRPMGTFQLLDYVGLDVAQKIGRIMNQYLSADIYSDELVGGMLKAGAAGGQHSDGSQKNGFFQYTNHQISGIYLVNEKRYKALTEGNWKADCDQALGKIPPGLMPWKVLQKDPQKDEKIKAYFEGLKPEKSLGAELAREIMVRSVEIAQGLVDDGVAHSMADVDSVLMNGFYHLYGPSREVMMAR